MREGRGPYPWGGVHFPSEALAGHFAVTGIAGAGKTLMIRMLMKAALVPDDGQLLARAIVYDPKRDFYPLLLGMGIPEDSIIIANPFDNRSYAWDIARDITDLSTSRQFAEILIPPEKNAAQPFFTDAAIDLLDGVITILRLKLGANWTLNDALEAFSSPKHLTTVLNATDEGRDLIQSYLDGDPEVAANILATLRTKVSPYRIVARLWATSSRRFHLHDWMRKQDPRVILLGTDDTNSASLDPINRALFQRASQLVTGRVDEYPEDETWIIMDEARFAGHLTGLDTLLLKGRSKGTHVVLGFQDILGLRSVYGKEKADELVGQCGNLAVLKLMNPETAEWASKVFGRYEEYVLNFGTSHGPQGITDSINYSFTERWSILAQQFRTFPLPTEGGITGAFVFPGGAWVGTMPEAFLRQYLREPLNTVPNFEPRADRDPRRIPWTEEFVRALKTASARTPLRSMDAD